MPKRHELGKISERVASIAPLGGSGDSLCATSASLNVCKPLGPAYRFAAGLPCPLVTARQPALLAQQRLHISGRHRATEEVTLYLVALMSDQ
jgi:hypothetical protein